MAYTDTLIADFDSIFNQTFELHDLVIVGLLIILEGVLSIDNALVLGLLAKRLPRNLQGRALTYGLMGAFIFRVIAIALAAYLLNWRIVKLIGGGYLVYVAGKHFYDQWMKHGTRHIALTEDGTPQLLDPDTGLPSTPPATNHPRFWATVAVIELTDIAFAIDSILAAIALVGPAEGGETPHPKLWVVVTGGMLGVILMRFAAVVFIRLLERFPRFETAAYLLVALIGLKLGIDWWFNTKGHEHTVDFHNYQSAPFWVFWILMLVCFSVGFIRKHEPVLPPFSGSPQG